MNRIKILRILSNAQKGLSKSDPTYYYLEYLKFLVLIGDIKVNHIKDVRTEDEKVGIEKLAKNIEEVFGK